MARNNPNFKRKKEPGPKQREQEKNRKGKPKGELNDFIYTPENRVRKGPICGAQRTGKSSAGPGICCQPAGWGTDHRGYGRCKNHGGMTLNQRQAAGNEKSLAEIDQALKLYGGSREIDPHAALLELVHRTAGHVEWLGAFIQDLESPEKLRQITDMGTHPSVWVKLYQDERKILMEVSKTAINAGVAEREVRLKEEQGRMLAAVIQAVLTDPNLGLTPAQLVVAPKIVREKITTIAIEAQEAIEDAEVVEDGEVWVDV